MQELVGRLTALDPQASETLKVIAYFDALVAGGARVPALVRAAATLSGVTAGAVVDGRTLRFRPDGAALDGAALGGPASAGWPSRPATSRDWVWIERSGAAHANDAMVLERFALAVSIRRGGLDAPAEDALRVVIDAARTPGERAEALGRLALPPGELRIAVTAPAVVLRGPSTLVSTRAGAVRAIVLSAGDRPDDVPEGARLGLGPAGPASRLPRSFAGADVAFRLTDDPRPVVDAADLGILLDVAGAVETTAVDHPDVAALQQLDPAAASALDTLVRADSIRQAAQQLGVHHSTLQARHERLSHDLGYDPLTPTGRSRYVVAALLARLEAGATAARFGSSPSR